MLGIVRFAATAIGAAYLAIILAMYLGQRALIYPVPANVAPLPDGFEHVELRTEDGLVLKAAWKPPADGMPSAVFFHGNADSWNGASAATERLASEGYGLLLPEYRGYGGNPGTPDEAGLYRDGRAALAFLDQAGIPGERRILIGNSLGTGVATHIAAQYPAKALVLISPYSSLPDAGAAHYPWLPVRLLMKDRFANQKAIASVDIPTLVLHGTRDRVIPFGHAQNLAQASPTAELYLLEGEGHGLAFSDAGKQAVSRWLAGLQE